MIPQTAEYAMRSLIWLAAHSDAPQTSKRIAEVTHVPAGYLYKVLQAMAAAGLIRSQPGPSGGYTLVTPAEEITLRDVVELVQPIPRIRGCPLHNEDHAANLCPLHRKLDGLYAMVQQTLGEVTIADLVEADTKGCEHPILREPTYGIADEVCI